MQLWRCALLLLLVLGVSPFRTPMRFRQLPKASQVRCFVRAKRREQRLPDAIVKAQSLVLQEAKRSPGQRSSRRLEGLWDDVRTWIEERSSTAASKETDFHLLSLFLYAFSDIPTARAAPVTEIVQMMDSRGHKFDAGNLHNLVVFHTTRGEPDDALAVFVKLRSQGIEPKPATLSAVLTSYVDERRRVVRWDDVQRFWRLFCFDPAPPNAAEDAVGADKKSTLYLDMLAVAIQALSFGSISMERFIHDFDELMTGYSHFFSSFPAALAQKLCKALEERAGANQNLESPVAPSPHYTGQVVDFSSEGKCPACTREASQVSLSTKDRAALRSAILKLAAASGPSNLQSVASFSRWLRRKAREGHHFDYILDGANIAYTKQNYAEGRFSVVQIALVKHHLEQLGAKVLVLLPQKYCGSVVPNHIRRKGKDRKFEMVELDEDEQQLLQAWQETNQLYSVETGVHDDYLWMLATVANEQDRMQNLTRVVSNDLMRNHRKWLLNSRDFLRWRFTQVVHFELSHGIEEYAPLPEVVIFEPPPFSREIQRTEHGWHIPLCAAASSLAQDSDGLASKHLWSATGGVEFDDEAPGEDEKLEASRPNDAADAPSRVDESEDPVRTSSMLGSYAAMRDDLKRSWLCLQAT